jgi:large subunit ribosomal protein L25
MAEIELQAEPRSILGKNVAKLRRSGITPANIYGHNVASQAIQLSTIDLTHTLRAARGTHLVRLSLTGEQAPRMVLVRQISRKPTNDQLLHVDFYEVSMTEKTTVEIPIVLVGAAPIADSGDGLVIQQIQALTVECLPGDIPDHIEADISSLVDLHSAVHVSDLRLASGVTTSWEPTDVVISVSRKVMAEEEEEAAEAAEGELAEAAAPTEEAAAADEETSEET